MFALTLALACGPYPSDTPTNPAIDPVGHRQAVDAAHKHRTTRRLKEDDFLKAMGEKGTILLDCRSKDKYDLLHIKGAVNLPFSDIDIPTLAKVLPDKTARILIYCNNNFQNVGPAKVAMMTKAPSLSLNLSTYTALHASGYHNLWELGPQLDPRTTKLPLAGTDAARR